MSRKDAQTGLTLVDDEDETELTVSELKVLKQMARAFKAGKFAAIAVIAVTSAGYGLIQFWELLRHVGH